MELINDMMIGIIIHNAGGRRPNIKYPNIRHVTEHDSTVAHRVAVSLPLIVLISPF